MFAALKRDFIERFMNFETFKGVYLFPAGAVVIYVSLYFVQYLMQVVGCLFGLYCVSEGLRKIFVNRIKLEAEKKRMVAERIVAVEANNVATPEG